MGGAPPLPIVGGAPPGQTLVVRRQDVLEVSYENSQYRKRSGHAAKCAAETPVGYCAGVGCFWHHGDAECKGTKCFCKPGSCSYDGWTCVNGNATISQSLDMSTATEAPEPWDQSVFLGGIVGAIVGFTLVVGSFKLGTLLVARRRRSISD